MQLESSSGFNVQHGCRPVQRRGSDISTAKPEVRAKPASCPVVRAQLTQAVCLLVCDGIFWLHNAGSKRGCGDVWAASRALGGRITDAESNPGPQVFWPAYIYTIWILLLAEAGIVKQEYA